MEGIKMQISKKKTPRAESDKTRIEKLEAEVAELKKLLAEKKG
jgi:uncharacterized protein YceH (UPF0502 family)